jgi:uncharacterized OsmC-like protein
MNHAERPYPKGSDMPEEKCCGATSTRLEETLGDEPADPAERKCAGEPASRLKNAGCAVSPAQQTVVTVAYDGSEHAIASHVASGGLFSLDGCGQGASPNPIDLLAMALAGCLLIVMGKAAEARRLDIQGARAEVSYDLVNYRITAVSVVIQMPHPLDPQQQARLEASSRSCPVYLAINPEVQVSVNFVWPE